MKRARAFSPFRGQCGSIKPAMSQPAVVVVLLHSSFVWVVLATPSYAGAVHARVFFLAAAHSTRMKKLRRWRERRRRTKEGIEPERVSEWQLTVVK